MAVDVGVEVRSRPRIEMPAGLTSWLLTQALTLERAAQKPWFWGATALTWAFVTWIFSLQALPLERMNDLGLISVLPWPIYISFAVLIVCFCLALRERRPNERLLLALTALGIVMLYGMAAVAEELPRFVTAWKHVGFVEFITRTGRVAPNLEARFDWPGFFILAGLLTKVAGLENALPFLAWAPVYFSLLCLGPLLMIFRSLTDDRRVVWLGVWLFYLGNWIAQDYFSPQAFSYFLYLTILAVLLRWFRMPGVPATAASRTAGWLHGFVRSLVTPREQAAAPSGEWQRTGQHMIVVLLLAVMAPSHQLTPFVTLSALVLLVALNRCRLRSLPLLSAVLTASWIIFMTVAYLSGNLQDMLGEIGRVGEALDSNVTGHMRGSELHVLVVNLRLAMTALVWALALLGGLRRLRLGHWDLTCALLAVAPFPLLVLQSYGGEMLLRIHLFALPFATLFAAMLFYPATGAGHRARTTVALCLLSGLLLVGLVVCRFGNERAEHMTTGDLEAVQFLYANAPRYSAFVAVTTNMPWQYRDWEAYDYLLVANRQMPDSIDKVLAVMRDEEECRPTYLILTRSQRDEMEQAGYSPEDWTRLEQAVATSPALKPIFRNDTASIWVLADAQEAQRP